MRSELCLFDLTAGTAHVVLGHPGHIEAPNWHPDGQSLIVNGDGCIWRVPLDRPALQLIDTGFARGCNNDHGPSPDGRWLAISDKTETGQSCIYILPISGGQPRRVTPEVPSWWHAWSPDGATLAYVGARGGRRVLLYTCPAAGGPETCLTPDFDHVDGPDYSPDGAWIWFNGERAGAVDLWRIRPDGTGLQQMTDDAFVNWFPHPSPDGAHVVYIAYAPGTVGHPGGVTVTLRLMPAAGGAARDLLAVFGGQGCLNVPCWAPDSRSFAFMRYLP